MAAGSWLPTLCLSHSCPKATPKPSSSNKDLLYIGTCAPGVWEGWDCRCLAGGGAPHGSGALARPPPHLSLSESLILHLCRAAWMSQHGHWAPGEQGRAHTDPVSYPQQCTGQVSHQPRADTPASSEVAYGEEKLLGTSPESLHQDRTRVYVSCDATHSTSLQPSSEKWIMELITREG